MSLAEDIKATIHDLEEDATLKAIHNRLRLTLRPLAELTLSEDLPDHFTRGDSMAVRLPTLQQLAQAISADTINFATTTTVTLAMPPFTDAAQAKAEGVEKWLSAWRARIDEGRSITSDTRQNLLLQSFTVMQLHCGDPASRFPWSVEVPESLTCLFPVQAAPFRPKVFGRHYQQTFKELQRQYSNRRKYSDDRALYLKKGGGISWFEGKLGDDYPADTAQSDLYGKLLEVYELHEGSDICVIACGLDENGKSTTNRSEVIWEGKSLTGGVSAVVGSAGGTSFHDYTRLQPMLMPGFQYMINLNNLRAARASRSIGARPDVFFNPSPEQIAAMSQVSGDPQAFQQFIEAYKSFNEGGPRFIVAPGEPIPWQLQQDPDLDKSIEDVAVNLSAYIAAYQQTANEKVIQEANTNVFLPYAEAIRNRQAPMLTQSDWMWKQVEQMALYSIKEYNRAYPLFSTGAPLELHGNYEQLEGGKELTISPEDVDLDRYTISVTTNSVTEAETRLRIQDYEYRRSIGVSTRREVIGSAGYSDVDLQIEAIAKDKGIDLGVAWNDQVLAQYLQDYMRLTAGIYIPTYGLQPNVPDVSATTPQPYSPPALQPAQGGSEAPQ